MSRLTVWLFLGDLQVCFLLFVAVLSGCSTQQKGAFPAPFFAIGINGAGSVTNLPIIRSAGFNAVYGGYHIRFLDAARTNDLKVLVAGVPAKGDLRFLDQHPGVWAWTLADEPEMKGVPPAELEQAHRDVKARGAKKPTAIILFKGNAAGDYANITDITICDRYPIPWLPLCSFGQHLRMVRLALGKEKPLIAIIQAFDWRYYAEQMAEDPARMRPPTYEEIRCMTYCALAQRVSGLMYYAYDDGPGRWRMQEHPETWQALCKVVQEVKARLPLFQAEHVWWPKDHRWQERDRMYNLALESSIDAVLLRVGQGNSAVPKGTYIMAVNNTDQRQVYSFTLPFSVIGGVPVLGENRNLTPQTDWLTDTFAPYAVHVYGPLTQEGR